MNMNIRQWNPVNWFKHEEKEEARNLPSKLRGFLPAMSDDPLLGIHQEIDRMFDGVFSGMGMERLPGLPGNKTPANSFSKALLKPNVDIKERKKDYKITVEVPGVEESDIKLEINEGALIISGEKKYEKEEKDEHYHSVERSYGSFRRVLSLPDDADENSIDAKFKNGVLTVFVARKAVENAKTGAKQIEIKNAA